MLLSLFCVYKSHYILDYYLPYAVVYNHTHMFRYRSTNMVIHRSPNHIIKYQSTNLVIHRLPYHIIRNQPTNLVIHQSPNHITMSLWVIHMSYNLITRIALNDNSSYNFNNQMQHIHMKFMIYQIYFIIQIICLVFVPA